jgi:RNA polymerase sigma factor (sigma-70 family)
MDARMDDTTLLKAFQAGDPGAEKMIFDRYFGPLTLFAERITRDLGAAEDIAVEALTKCIDRRMHFAAIPKVKSFLFQVVYNASINEIDNHGRHQAVHAKIGYELAGDMVEPVEADILRAEVLEEIYREIEALPDKCGQIFKLIFIEELTTDKIARRLGIDVQTVRSQKSRAIGMIRTSLLKKGRLATLVLFYCWLRGLGH